VRCPYCHYEDTKVADSRLGVDGAEVRRRRHCTECNERFTTYERLERRYPRILKSNGSVEPFNEDKIRRGVMRSLEKRKVSNSEIERLIEKVCENISKLGVDQTESSVIGEEILRELGKVDDVAYVRFASVYRRFENVNDFTQELKKIEQER
jgi:transcriptional repressor NrdR